ncbi:MAG: PIN domain-containing protein [Burkholderiaceae bacterium]|nr:PIN domain-containing protein [Burkholderiaceae bacterium]
MSTFFDTDVLVYAMDADDPARQEIAIERSARAAREDSIVLSTQVLQEFYNITTRKLHTPLSAVEATRQLTQLSAFEAVGASAQSVLAAAELARKHRLPWWDALILEAALRANADVLVTENGQHG